VTVSHRPEDLPDYGRPPIDEVAITAQFLPIEGFQDAHIGLYWQQVQDEYPRAESQPRIEGPIEVLTPNWSPPIQFQIPLGVAPQVRTWLISSDDSFLIQIQNNRFAYNWRKRGNDYPHFDSICRAFLDRFEGFRQFLQNQQLPNPAIQQIEVTYINWIVDLTMPEFFRPAAVTELTAPGIGQPEDQNWAARYLVHREAGPFARLYVQCQPAIRASPPPVGPGSQLAVVFRAPISETLDDDGLASYLGEGRNAIVRAFTDLTTEAAHRTWDRIQ
jgi:uncharacterized protein (TIGR04255 family)